MQLRYLVVRDTQDALDERCEYLARAHHTTLIGRRIHRAAFVCAVLPRTSKRRAEKSNIQVTARS